MGRSGAFSKGEELSVLAKEAWAWARIKMAVLRASGGGGGGQVTLKVKTMGSFQAGEIHL